MDFKLDGLISLTTYTAQVYLNSTSATVALAMTEKYPGRYEASVPTSPPLAAGSYVVIFRNTAIVLSATVLTKEVARADFEWDGTKEVTGSGSSLGTVDFTPLQASLNEIRDWAKLSALPLDVDEIVINPVTFIAEYKKNGITVRRSQQFDVNGNPANEDVFRQTKLSIT